MRRAPVLAALVTAALAALAACTPRPHAPAPGGDPLSSTPAGVVPVTTARALVEAGARLVDVRTPAEFAAGHAEGAVNIPVDELPGRAAELGGAETPVVLYCRSGNRSAQARRTLAALGYRRVWDFQRYDAWAAARGDGGAAPAHRVDSTQ